MASPRFTCNRCTRQLSRISPSFQVQPALSRRNILACKALTSITLSHKYLRSSFHTSSGHHAEARALPTRDSFAKARFTMKDVPPRDFFVSQAKTLVPTSHNISADDIHAAVTGYAKLALSSSSDKWLKSLTTPGDKDLIHYAAICIIVSPRAPSWHLATHILYSLVQVDYAPGILTLAAVGLKSNNLDKPNFEPSTDALARLLDRPDLTDVPEAPDACTLMGLICKKRGTEEDRALALRWFRRAYELGMPVRRAEQARGVKPAESDIWQWQTSFALSMAGIYKRRNNVEKARPFLEMAAHDLDHNEGLTRLAIAKVDIDEVERDRMLTRAAASGNRRAARLLGERLLKSTMEEGISAREKKEREMMAEEWGRLAEDSAD
ncbi:hypothetical protein F5Y15DRAFT_298643 [Xylariaceae sp. FL0016]|nr:hypothetical protein F5Y15DRAFT_298643 [Xylariaceae sp. FL0016]